MNVREAGFVVVDVWKVKPGHEDAVKQVLARAKKQFSAVPEILSVDYCLVDEKPNHYLVVFRYTTEEAREKFVATDELVSTMAHLRDHWDLADVFVKGPAAPLKE